MPPPKITMIREKKQSSHPLSAVHRPGSALGLIAMSVLLLSAGGFLVSAVSQKNITGIVTMALALVISSVAFLFSVTDYLGPAK